jgi:hypothetical protein
MGKPQPAEDGPRRSSTERDAATVWQAGLAGFQLIATDGTAVTVVAPGVPGGGPGPDFRHAVLVLGGDLRFGDVEIHLRSSGWVEHGHDQDAAYNGVILHVVTEDDAGAPVQRADGASVITVVLPLSNFSYPVPDAPRTAVGAEPCRNVASRSLPTLLRVR